MIHVDEVTGRLAADYICSSSAVFPAEPPTPVARIAAREGDGKGHYLVQLDLMVNFYFFDIGILFLAGETIVISSYQPAYTLVSPCIKYDP